jgi:hypothetical protein
MSFGTRGFESLSRRFPTRFIGKFYCQRGQIQVQQATLNASTDDDRHVKDYRKSKNICQRKSHPVKSRLLVSGNKFLAKTNKQNQLNQKIDLVTSDIARQFKTRLKSAAIASVAGTHNVGIIWDQVIHELNEIEQ